MNEFMDQEILVAWHLSKTNLNKSTGNMTKEKIIRKHIMKKGINCRTIKLNGYNSQNLSCFLSLSYGTSDMLSPTVNTNKELRKIKNSALMLTK